MNQFYTATKSIVIILSLCILSIFYSACNKSRDNDYNPAEVSHFGFDSFPKFKEYAFYIDNFGNQIYNKDSFPFQSDVDSLFPSITTLSTNDKSPSMEKPGKTKASAIGARAVLSSW